jgi:alkanesulfonate monooxygenase SsuD/methylene tetrahydromethanopterin reductase-like flavin-dependent oxidoreductase (luciferase family)
VLSPDWVAPQVPQPFESATTGRMRETLAVRLGYFTMPLHPAGRDYLQTLREDREAIILADELGFAEAFVGEHVTDISESVTDCCVFLASLAPVVSQITLGTGTVNLPNGHPAAIATKVAMLDHLLEGRLVFGVSPGGLPSDWEVFGNLDVDRRAKFLECLEHVIGIWSGEPPYDLAGEHWRISTARTMIPEIGQGVMVRPYQKPHPPIAVTVVEPSSRSAAEAAVRGWDIISANFLLPQWVRTHWTVYSEAAGDAAPDPANWRVAKTVLVTDDDRTARSYGFGPDSPYRHYYAQLGFKLIRAGRANIFKPDPELPDSWVTTDTILEHLVIAGTPAQVTEELLAFREEVGDFGTLLYCGIDWVDPQIARRSMELMADVVMPDVNRHLRAAEPV